MARCFPRNSLQQRQSISLTLFCNVCISEAVVQSCSVKKVFLKILQNLQVFPLAQVFPNNFCEILKNTFFHRTPPVAASGICAKLDFLF